jgi:senataxin
MNTDHPTAEQVEAILAGATGKYPTDSELIPVFNFLLPTVDVPLSTSATSSSTSTSKSSIHFYCSKCHSATHREAATYLLYLFAFERAGTASKYMQGLEKALNGCVNCARAFGGAKRRFGHK